jgi:hypothetical protein
MKNRFTLAITAGVSLLLCQCGDPCSPPAPGSWGAMANKVAGAVVDHFLGAPVSSLPYSNPQCVDMTPGLDEQALGSGSGSACGAASDDDACVTCAKTSCCDVSLACWKEENCTCNVACKTAGCDSATSVKCGEPDAAFDAVRACVTDHCAQECPAL